MQSEFEVYDWNKILTIKGFALLVLWRLWHHSFEDHKPTIA